MSDGHNEALVVTITHGDDATSESRTRSRRVPNLVRSRKLKTFRRTSTPCARLGARDSARQSPCAWRRRRCGLRAPRHWPSRAATREAAPAPWTGPFPRLFPRLLVEDVHLCEVCLAWHVALPPVHDIESIYFRYLRPQIRTALVHRLRQWRPARPCSRQREANKDATNR